MNGTRIDMLRRVIAMALLAGLSTGAAKADPSYLITTGIEGAQTQIDVNHTSRWTFLTSDSFLLAGGNFTIKDGPKTEANIVLSLYRFEGGSYVPVTTVTLGPGDVPQKFQPTAFLFDKPVLLQGDSFYVAELTSKAADPQAEAYFIKGNSPEILDEKQQRAPVVLVKDGINPEDYNGSAGLKQPIGANLLAAAVAVPEPTSIALLGAGLLGLGAIRRRR